MKISKVLPGCLKPLLDGGAAGFQWEETKRFFGGFLLFVLKDSKGFNPGIVGLIGYPPRLGGTRWIEHRVRGLR